jgi:hypothetical protein
VDLFSNTCLSVLQWYHVGVWGSSLISSLLLRYYSADAKQEYCFPSCFIAQDCMLSAKKGNQGDCDDWPYWAFSYSAVAICYGYCSFVLINAYMMFRAGLEDPQKYTVHVFRKTCFCLIVLVVEGMVQNLLSIIVLTTSGASIGPDSFAHQGFNFMVGARGYVDFLVWFQLSPFSFPGTSVKKVKRYEHDVQLNTALQHEVVHFTTTGIKLSAKRFSSGKFEAAGSQGMQLPAGWLERAADMACGDGGTSSGVESGGEESSSPESHGGGGGRVNGRMNDGEGGEMDRFGSGRGKRREKKARERKEKREEKREEKRSAAAQRGREGDERQKRKGGGEGLGHHANRGGEERRCGEGGDDGGADILVREQGDKFGSGDEANGFRTSRRGSSQQSFFTKEFPEDILMLEPLRPKQTKKRFTSYHTATFGEIRQMFGVDESSYAKSLSKVRYRLYTPLIHSSHALLSCTPLIHSSHALLSCTPLMHSSHCTPLIHRPRKRA